jgi:hypothetical protein
MPEICQGVGNFKLAFIDIFDYLLASFKMSHITCTSLRESWYLCCKNMAIYEAYI